MKTKKQIIALGGGGFSMEEHNLALDQYILDQANHPRPNVCFLGTASGDAQSYLDKFYRAYRQLPCNPSHLSLFKPFSADLESILLNQQVIFVGGGNTKSMLALWKEWSVDQILRNAYEKGVILAGISAGSICWFEQGLTDSIPGNLTAIRGLGFLRGSHCPHYDGELERRPKYEQFILEGKIAEGMAAEDGVAVHYVDGTIHSVVASIEFRNAYMIRKKSDEISAEVLKPRCLNPVKVSSTKIQRTFTGAPWESKVGYCRAIKVGQQIFISGTAPVSEDSSTFAPNDAYQQAKRCFELIKRSLLALGSDLSHVVRTRMFVTEVQRWEEFAKAHQEFFGEYPPATTMVEVKSLIDPEMLIEIEADAVMDS